MPPVATAPPRHPKRPFAPGSASNVESCRRRTLRTVTFKVNGKEVAQTAINEIKGVGVPLDLAVR